MKILQIFLLIFLLIFCSCRSSSKNISQKSVTQDNYNQSRKIDNKENNKQDNKENDKENIEANKLKTANKSSKSVSFVFVGDIMTHPLLVERIEAEQKALMHFEKYLAGRDIAFANLEFTVNTNKPAGGYPNFNGSYDYLKYFSRYFNVFSVANNHVYDQGTRAQTETMGFLADFGNTAIGGSTNDSRVPPVITNIGGIDIYLAAYSSTDNGLAEKYTKRGRYTYYMNFYPYYNKMLAKIKKDHVGVAPNAVKIVSIHYGKEYTTNTQPEDVSLMRAVIDSGVDVVVAHHPHVVRPVEYYEGKNHSGVIMYSLGNFLANHKSRYEYLDIGAAVFLTVGEDRNKNKTYKYDYLATYIYYFDNDGVADVRVIPIARNPERYGLPFKGIYDYHQTNIDRIKSGYKLVDEFFSPLTNL